MKRTLIKNLGENIRKEVLVKGWVDIRRDHGKLIFIDLRDFSGLVQAVSTPKEDSHKVAETIRPEWVVEVKGMVNERPENMVNADIQNGNIELKITEIKVLNEAQTPPIDIQSDGKDIGEENRLKYRYLDLRRKRMQKNLRNRSKALTFIRNYLEKEDFTEVETPILSKSTPEGARDFIVPSRIDKGKFYALPQSPQQYKQLLMVAGMERYFQIARCFRDEDSRGDRQPEFTQLDIEASFVSQDDIMDLLEGVYTEVVKKFYPDKKITKSSWPRLNYQDVIKEYGTDSPDLRKDKNNPNELAFAWIINFPLFTEQSEKDFFHGSGSAKFAPSHHMFAGPNPEDVSLLDSEPQKVRGLQHDLVLNGNEIGGGSVRIHDPKIQEKVFDLIGFSAEQKKKFKHILEAFTYGVPPHGGIAMGFDRFMMILENEESIREVFSFPKTGEGRDPMMEAPSEVEEDQLKELGIEVKKKK